MQEQNHRSLTIGIIIDAVPSMKLKIPPAIPISLFGASNETNTQGIEAKPSPKKAIHMNKITRLVLSTKFAPMIEVESNNPDITGTVSEQHCGIRSSFYKNGSVPCGD